MGGRCITTILKFGVESQWGGQVESQWGVRRINSFEI